MEELQKVENDWTSVDAKALRDFLATDTGRRALMYVADVRPPLMDGSDVNKTLVRNGEVKGFDIAITTLVELTTRRPDPTESRPELYPNLDDDSKWQDSQKLNPEKTP